MNLRTDYAFKKFFGSKEYAHLLIRFLNSIFEGRMTVTDVTFENKEILPSRKGRKTIVYDVYCTTEAGQHFILEMQNVNEELIDNRFLFYSVKALAEQIKKGGTYSLKPVYAIFVINFEMDNMSKGIPHEIGLLDKMTGEIFSDKLNIFLLPLPLAKSRWADCVTDYDHIIYLIKNMHNMDKNSEAYRSGEYEDFFEAAELGSMAQEEIEAYSQSYARLQDMENAVAYSFAKGEQAGFSKGEQAGFSKGEQLGKFSTIRQLFKGGFKIDDIARSLGMSSQEVHDIVSNPI